MTKRESRKQRSNWPAMQRSQIDKKNTCRIYSNIQQVPCAIKKSSTEKKRYLT
ncbi:hypothetical protein [Porphyromonas pogonae]|uniref:hypothetical protein n=1 Tax=Porphyromonas pogonae TaxID=867595 RepID=UPI002E788E89|nr:hypothetical protein [Porphyromonas pogonae]